VNFSYTQISQYLRCPRSYRFRYLDGWRETESRASLCFGRCFEKALAAFFNREDPGAVLFKQWEVYRETPLEYSHGDDWERLLRQGIALLEQFARDNRIRIRQPQRNLQKKLVRPLPNGNEFVAYSVASPTLPLWPLFGNASRRFNTCWLRLAKSSAGNLASWLKQQSVKSKRLSSLHILASVSRRMDASAALTSVCALGTSHW
jgi:hypothetical protein